MARERPRLPKIDPEMQRWCALIEQEISSWPDVSSKPMFGLAGYYRGHTIFAVIPRTRAMEAANAVHAKLPGRGWIPFLLEDESDIPRALRHIERAYDRARPTPRSRVKR